MTGRALDRLRSVEEENQHQRLAAREEIGRLLERALRAWPDNQAARRGRVENLAERSREDLARGDLLGARLHLDRLRGTHEPDSETVRELEGLLERGHARQRRQGRRRRIVALAALAFSVLALGAIWRSLHEAGQRRLFARVNSLHAAETELGAKLESALPLPRRVPGSRSVEATELDRERVAGLLAESRVLRAERERLQDAIPARLGEEPYALLLGEANLAYHSAKEPPAVERALELYRDANRRRSELPEPLIGMGLSSIRLGNLVEGTRILERAADSMALVRGPRHVDTARALALVGEAWLRVDSSSAEAIASFEASLSILAPQWVELTQVMAGRFHVLARFEDALEFARLSQTEAIDLGDGERSRAATSTLLQAENLLELERLDEAEVAIRSALELESSGVESVLKELATVQRRSGRLEQALSTLDRALTLVRASSSGSAVEAQILNNRGLVLRSLGRPLEAETDYRASIALAERVQGTDHPDLGTTLYNLGRLLRELGRLEEASSLVTRSLVLFESVHGPEHPDLQSPLTTLGLILAQLEQYDEAVVLLRRALDIARRIYGPEHANAAKAMVSLGRTLSSTGRVEEAITMCSRAAEILEQWYGSGHAGPESRTTCSARSCANPVDSTSR